MATTDTTLYRSLNKADFPDTTPLIKDNTPATGVLYPSFTETRFKAGGAWRTRAPDVTLSYVKDETQVASGGGTSLWDKDKVFKNYDRNWRSFVIPSGTVIPDSLAVVKGGYNAAFAATHYQIEVKTGAMEISAFKGALDNLARNAVVQAIALAK